jgi:hypothetical protein
MDKFAGSLFMVNIFRKLKTEMSENFNYYLEFFEKK